MTYRGPWWAALTWLMWTSVVQATTMILADEQKLATAADAVVMGRVEAVRVRPDPRRNGVLTEVQLNVQDTWKGSANGATIEITELGGDLGTRSEHYFGTPEYRVGEKVLVFLSQRPDGTLHTLGLAMGKFRLIETATGSFALRHLGEGTNAMEWDGQTLRKVPGRALYAVEDLRRSVRSVTQHRRSAPARALTPDEEKELSLEYVAPFGLMGSPGRWFQADAGEPVGFRLDSRGDLTLGFERTKSSVHAAMAAWSNVRTSTIQLVDLGPIEAGTVDCTGPSQILFNDPTGALRDPFFCSGVLAVGGYCSEDDTMEVNGVEFRRITTAKIIFNDGWGACPFWNECNVAEVVTHELGHAIGIGHSENSRATMFAYAHFDGRCASVGADDVAAVSFIYPASANMHDVVVAPVAPVRAVIRAGESEAFVPLNAVVRHADSWGGGTWVQLLARDGSCPAGTVGGANFGTFTQPDQIYLQPGEQAKATVWLRLRAADFSTPDARSPARCNVELEAVPVVADNLDPVPGNERVETVVDVVDKNDTGSKAVPTQTSLRAVKPVSLRIPFGRAMQQKKLNVPVRSAATSQITSVSMEPGTCPAGIIGPALLPRSVTPFQDVPMRANSQRSAQMLLSVDRSQVSSLFPGSPVRCTAYLIVEGDAADADPSNNTLPVVIDLQDDNDL